MKVEDPKKRKRLADQVARGELTLIKLRDKIEGRRSPRPARAPAGGDDSSHDESERTLEEAVPQPVAQPRPRPGAELSDDSLVNAKTSLADALDQLVGVLRSPDAVASIPDVDRVNLAKYLTIAKLRLENAIAIVRTGHTGD
jgi:hypothetical protein